jgi:dihydroorotase-like cyclic amidohydrolase
MRYLTLSKSGIWQFRYQIPLRLRLHFDDRCEIKRSLKTSSKRTAKILALKLELEILQKKEASFLSDELPLSAQVEKICPPLCNRTLYW